MDGWVRPGLILGALAVLIVLNVLEFRAKRRRDREEMQRLGVDERPEAWLARQHYVVAQNTEQVLHVINAVLIALLVAMLTA